MQSSAPARAALPLKLPNNGQSLMDSGHLILMANQIAANLMREADPAQAVASHIVQFWDPRMIAAIRAADQSGLSPVAAAAVAQLAA